MKNAASALNTPRTTILMKGNAMIHTSMKTTTVLVFILAAPSISAAQPIIVWNADQGQAVVMNGSLELIVETKAGLNPRSLRDVQGGAVYADRDYSWPGGARPVLRRPRPPQGRRWKAVHHLQG